MIAVALLRQTGSVTSARWYMIGAIVVSLLCATHLRGNRQIRRALVAPQVAE